MPTFRCNACGGTYVDPQPDGTAYTHACSPEVVEYAQHDKDGNITKPEVRKPRLVMRDENPAPGYITLDGKTGRMVHNPHDAQDVKFVEEPRQIKREGAGRTQLD